MILTGDPTWPQRAEALASAGAAPRTYARLCEAAAAGDGHAAWTIAIWRMTGAHIDRDLAEAQRAFSRAAELGHPDAARYAIALDGNGAGNAVRDWPGACAQLRRRAPSDHDAAIQTALLDAMPIDAEGNPSQNRPFEAMTPAATVARSADFLSRDEATYLISRAMALLAPSVVVDPATGRMMHDLVRTSTFASFPFLDESPAIHAINRRIAAATGTTWEQGEPLQVLCYDRGQQYRRHHDALPHPVENQRRYTFLVALNDGYEGGSTDFPDLNIRWKGRPGEALWFTNTDAAGTIDRSMDHMGSPVTRGCKFILSKWIRARPLDLTVR